MLTAKQERVMKSSLVLTIAAVAALAGGSAVAEPVSVEVAYTTKEQMRYDFADGSNRFVLAVLREGKAEGSGIFAGAAVEEFGWHDVHPPVSADPQGYLQLTTENGDVAVLRWSVKAVFTKGDDRPALFNNGFWELVGGTGQFEAKRGIGSIIIRAAEQKLILEGEVGDKP
jgi:hypothetical protein